MSEHPDQADEGHLAEEEEQPPSEDSPDADPDRSDESPAPDPESDPGDASGE